MAGATPTQNTLKKLRKEGWTVAVVEKWNHHVKIRQDLFGFIDIIAIKGEETLAVQATSHSNTSSRIKKIEEDEKIAPNVRAVRDAGWRIEVWGWRKVKNRWQARVVDVS